MTALLPRGGNCHYGSKLLQQGTVRLLATLCIFISKGQVMRPLIDGQDQSVCRTRPLDASQSLIVLS